MSMNSSATHPTTEPGFGIADGPSSDFDPEGEATPNDGANIEPDNKRHLLGGQESIPILNRWIASNVEFRLCG